MDSAQSSDKGMRSSNKGMRQHAWNVTQRGRSPEPWHPGFCFVFSLEKQIIFNFCKLDS